MYECQVVGCENPAEVDVTAFLEIIRQHTTVYLCTPHNITFP